MEIAPDKSTMLFHLYDGYNYEDVTNRTGYQNSRPFQKMKFGEQTRRFSDLGASMNRTDEELFRNNYQMMNLEQLSSYRDSLQAELTLRQQNLLKSITERFVNYTHYDTLATDTARLQLPSALPDTVYRLEHVDKNIRKAALDFALQSARSAKTNLEFSIPDFENRRERIRKHDIEWHRKFTLSIACLILFFIGAPLGAIIRKGGLGMPVVVSILFFVIYHIISITGEKYARAGILEPEIAMWLASAILLPVGIFLTYKATTDSPLLDAEAWNKILRNLLFFVNQKQ